MSKRAIAVDLGGTSIKLGLINRNGEILSRLELPTPVGQGEDAIVQRMAEGIDTLLTQNQLQRNDIVGVGLGVPGFLNKEQGIVVLAPNIGWSQYPVRTRLENLIQLPVFLDNDANSAAIGERWLGAGNMAENMIMVTIGTGVGGGIIIHGEIVNGRDGVGGEIGHITVNRDGVRCGCGKMGCLESEASATAIKRKAIERLQLGEESSLRAIWQEHQDITPRQVVEAAQTGDLLATDVLDQAACTLAIVLSGLTHALNPEKILIGGGISYAGDPLFRPLRQYFTEFTLSAAVRDDLIAPALLGNDAGMIGAAYNVFKNCTTYTSSDTIDV